MYFHCIENLVKSKSLIYFDIERREKEFEEAYTLGTLLGEGGFSIVYRGTRRKDDLQVNKYLWFYV